MLKSHPLSKLYPHLNFSGLSKEAPARSGSRERVEPVQPVEPPKPAIRAPSVDKNLINVEKPKKIASKPAPKVTQCPIAFKASERAKTPERELTIEVKEIHKEDVDNEDNVSEKSSEDKVAPAPLAPAPMPRLSTEEGSKGEKFTSNEEGSKGDGGRPLKPIIKRPNRSKPEPKPVPDRDTVLPSKGEKGLQRKYTQEQRKQMYLDRLSRKSIKTAEREVTAVNEVLEKVGNSVEGLKEEEQRLKKGLKLVNYAKFFTA